MTDEKEWVAGLITDTSPENLYMRATVRRELSMLQFEIPNIPYSTVQEISRALAGNDSKSCLDDEIAMYM